MNRKVILHTEASNGWGGQEIRILNEMLGMGSRGHRVLLAAPAEASIYQRACAAGIEVFDVKMHRMAFFPGLLALRKILQHSGAAIINTHSSRDSWIGSIAGRLTGRRVVRTRHISSRLSQNPFTRLVYGPLCDAIITTGEAIRNSLMEVLSLPPEKITSIPTGIDIENYRNAQGREFRSELGLSEENVIVGIAAVLRSWKGHPYIIRAMGRVFETHQEARLVIAGDGPVRDAIEEEARLSGHSDRIILTGHREDISRVIASFDIAVLGSYASEGVPQFALQAMAAGKPVVGTHVGGIPEVIQDGINGLLVPPREPVAMTQAVLTLLDNPDLRRKMGEEGFQRVSSSHSMGRMLDEVEALYERIL